MVGGRGSIAGVSNFSLLFNASTGLVFGNTTRAAGWRRETMRSCARVPPGKDSGNAEFRTRTVRRKFAQIAREEAATRT